MVQDMRSKKEIEQIVLDAARDAGVSIPVGGVVGEEPDFRFHTDTGSLGIEVSELVRPACTNHGILPLEQEEFSPEDFGCGPKRMRETGVTVTPCSYLFHQSEGEETELEELDAFAS